ncbi:hypothetical protein B0T14DRAFT_428178 [Immersiella caudata]|uniref:Uncharacterized protein n=1 Tax=Immersiella caudata TaxID=314043 RepID=A0AA39WZL4_9PEZI|nr:hypothetical protein B0T14DRAFT_428178 [Immersiella caudata]
MRTSPLLTALLLLPSTTATFWTVTSYFAISESTNTRSRTFSSTLTVNPTATPTASPISTSVWVQGYQNVTVVYVYINAADIPRADILTTSTRRTINFESTTPYAVSVTYTAPSSCPTPFTVRTVTSVRIPDAVTAQYTPIATHTSTRSNGGVTRYTHIIEADKVPATLNPMEDFYYSWYIRDCRDPTTTGSARSRGGGGSGSSGGSDLDDWTVCSALPGCTSLATWIIVVATLLPALFLFGFVESYFWFRRLMLGKGTLRFGTICWIILSLWVLCFTRQAQTRSSEDQMMLREKWKTIRAGQRIKLWFKWGFWHSYPVEWLGDPKVGGVPGVMLVQPGQFGAPGQPPRPGQPPYTGYPGYPAPEFFAPGPRRRPGIRLLRFQDRRRTRSIPIPLLLRGVR